ncbi:unnamed protein product [Staurois parvus]|uniref:Uncharacterized protein n=1 Tax=Staurois parvus TaxID=386267 RepID=A0ABN9HTA6_9NEOB|nr:unnamed protein product [Staurois parvus]
MKPTKRWEEETSDPQNSSPASKEEGENEDSEDSDQDGDEEDEEGSDKDEDQDLSSGSTSLSPEKEDQSTSLELEVEAASPASPCLSNDSQLVNQPQEDHAKQEKGNVTSGVASEEADSGNHDVEENLEMSVVEEDFDWGDEKNTELVNVPYEEARAPSSKEQGTRMCTETKNIVTDPKSPPTRGKEGKSSRLDKCINKIAGSLAHKVPIRPEDSPSVGSEEERFRHVNNKKLGSGRSTRTKEQSSNGKLVCIDTPGEHGDSVRKIAFSHSQSSNKNSEVVQLDNCKSSICSDTSNGVHTAVVMSSTPINRLKRKRDTSTPTDSVITVKVEEIGSNKRKRSAAHLTVMDWERSGKVQSGRKRHTTKTQCCKTQQNKQYIYFLLQPFRALQ